MQGVTVSDADIDEAAVISPEDFVHLLPAAAGGHMVQAEREGEGERKV